MRKLCLVGALAVLCGGGSVFAATSITPEEVPCLPEEENASVRASVAPDVGGTSVRLYFRRLHPLGAFYYNRMKAAGGGDYWSVFPRPERREQHQLTDEWWKVLETRDWMAVDGRDRAWLEEWLAAREREAAEYYVAVHDASGALIERSDVRLVDVQEPRDCRVELTAQQAGWAANMTVGETTELQANRELFHWLCLGIVTRISNDDLVRGDDFCRACVVSQVVESALSPAG